MAAITDLSDLINRRTGGSSGAPEDLFVFVDGRVGAAAATNPVVGRYVSLWQYNKSRSGSGAIPSTTETLTNTSIGSLMQTNPTAGKQKFLTGSAAVFNVYGTIMLYDRLVHSGGLSGAVATAQTTNLPTAGLTRYTSGVGNFIFVEVPTAIGTTATTATISYVNQAGATKTTPAFAIGGVGLREAQRIILVPLASGDTGVRKINNLTLAATTGTAGNLIVGIGHPINFIVTQTGGGATVMDHISGANVLPEVMSGACVAAIFHAATTTAPSGLLAVHFVEK